MMRDFKNNIKINYLYRDAGNHKVYGSEIFSNPENLEIAKIEEEIRMKLIDGEFFDPTKWQLRPLSFEIWDDDMDHQWNEFESIQYTSEVPSQNRTVSKFLVDIK